MQRKQINKTPLRILHVLAFLIGFALLSIPLIAAGENDHPARHQLARSCAAGSAPDILLKIAQSCAQDLKSNPSCRARSPRRDYVIIKDNSPRKPKGYLLLPVQCVTGVEDAQVLAAPVADFWHAAWIWSRKELPAVPASRIGVAVNSLGARGNDQLHFHLSCVDRGVRRTLARNEAKIPEYSSNSKPLQIELGVRHTPYQVMKVRGLAGDNSPFAVVDAIHDGNQSEMAKQGIAVVAAQRKGEFYVLNTTEEADGGGHAEELLDQSCR